MLHDQNPKGAPVNDAIYHQVGKGFQPGLAFVRAFRYGRPAQGIRFDLPRTGEDFVEESVAQAK